MGVALLNHFQNVSTSGQQATAVSLVNFNKTKTLNWTLRAGQTETASDVIEVDAASLNIIHTLESTVYSNLYIEETFTITISGINVYTTGNVNSKIIGLTGSWGHTNKGALSYTLASSLIRYYTGLPGSSQVLCLYSPRTDSYSHLKQVSYFKNFEKYELSAFAKNQSPSYINVTSMGVNLKIYGW